MDLFSAMRTFVRVMDAGSLSAAADRMDVAKSAVSRRLTDLEAHLGVQLLYRTTRQISLTDAGALYLDQCRRILSHVEEAEQSVSGAQSELKGRLKVAAPLSSGTLHLAHIINGFLALYPNIDFDLDLNDRFVNLVEEGLDLAIRVGRLEDSTLIARRLATIRLVVVASPAYVQQHGEPESPADLIHHQSLVYSNVPDSAQWRFADDTLFKSNQLRMPVRMRANNGEFLMHGLRAGMGIAVMPTFICYRELESGELIRLLPDYPLAEDALYALYPAQRYLPRRARVFIDTLVQSFGDVPYWDL